MNKGICCSSPLLAIFSPLAKVEKQQAQHQATSLLHRLTHPFSTPAAANPDRLQLQYVHGYRGYDARNNVHVVDAGSAA